MGIDLLSEAINNEVTTIDEETLRIRENKKLAIKQYCSYTEKKSILTWTHVIACVIISIYLSIKNPSMVFIAIALVTAIGYLVIKLFNSRYKYINKYIIFNDYVFLDDVTLKIDKYNSSELKLSENNNVNVYDSDIVAKKLYFYRISKSILLDESQYKKLRDLMTSSDFKLLMHINEFKNLLDSNRLINDKLTWYDVFHN